MVSTRYALRWERGGAWRGVLDGIRRRGRPGAQGRIKPRSCPDSKVGAYRGIYKHLSLPIVFVNHETDTGNAGFFLYESAYAALERVRFLGHQVRGECLPICSEDEAPCQAAQDGGGTGSVLSGRHVGSYACKNSNTGTT